MIMLFFSRLLKNFVNLQHSVFTHKSIYLTLLYRTLLTRCGRGCERRTVPVRPSIRWWCQFLRSTQWWVCWLELCLWWECWVHPRYRLSNIRLESVPARDILPLPIKSTQRALQYIVHAIVLHCLLNKICGNEWVKWHNQTAEPRCVWFNSQYWVSSVLRNIASCMRTVAYIDLCCYFHESTNQSMPSNQSSLVYRRM